MAAAVEVWHLMGGRIEWAALEPIVEMLGIDDPETLIAGLVQIRNHLEHERD